MGFAYDFAIRWDGETETKEELSQRLIDRIFLKPLRFNKPRVCFIGGQSGEGKSYAAIRIMELIYKAQGLNPMQYFEVSNIFTPLEYPNKLNQILYNPEYKKANVIILHEARDVVNAKLWSDFITRTIADVNAMSRAVKQLIFIIVSQNIRDISKDIRYTLNLYCTVSRSLNEHAKPKLTIFKIVFEDKDLEKPVLKHYSLRGFIVDKKGNHNHINLNSFEINHPDKELTTLFNRLDFESKSGIIKKKMEKLIKKMEKEAGVDNRLETILNWYTSEPDRLNRIGVLTKKTFKLSPDFDKVHNLTSIEKTELSGMIFKRVAEFNKPEVLQDGIITQGTTE